MRIRLAVEDMEPNHWIAWAVDLPGCFSSATTAQSAIANAPQKIIECFSWLSKHDGSLLVVDDTIETEVIETFQSFPSSEDPDYIVNAFFESDRQPLRYWDVEIVLRLLTWTRQDLLAVVHSLSHDTLNMSIPDEVRGSIPATVRPAQPPFIPKSCWLTPGRCSVRAKSSWLAGKTSSSLPSPTAIPPTPARLVACIVTNFDI